MLSELTLRTQFAEARQYLDQQSPLLTKLPLTSSFWVRGINRGRSVSLDRFEIEAFDFCTRPVGLSQESKARFHARIDVEAADVDPVTQFLPTVLVDKVFQHRGECHSVQRIVGLWFVHGDVGRRAFDKDSLHGGNE